jgi:hypothetical protein
MEAEITHHGVLDIQVCVPKNWSDAEILDFANSINPSGTTGGWVLRKQGDSLLYGDPERQPCTKHPDKIHVMLDA